MTTSAKIAKKAKEAFLMHIKHCNPGSMEEAILIDCADFISSVYQKLRGILGEKKSMEISVDMLAEVLAQVHETRAKMCRKLSGVVSHGE